LKSARQKRLNLQQTFSRLLKLKEMNPIFKALFAINNVSQLEEMHKKPLNPLQK